MTITIQPLSETDIPTFVRVELEAFRSHPRMPMLWPRGYTDDLYAYYETTKRTSFRDPASRFIKAVDDATGEMVAGCQMTLALDATAAAAANDDDEKPIVGPSDDDEEPAPANWPRGGNWEMRRWFAANSQKLIQSSFAGRPFMLVDYLVVLPQWQGHGIGAQLLDRAVREADSHGLPLGLESTPAGLTLYRKFGFAAVQTVKADMRLFGWEDEYDPDAAKRVWMVREAREADGGR